MTIFFIDGFDKYGSPVQVTGAGLATAFYQGRLQANMAGEWNSMGDTVNGDVWIDQAPTGTGACIAFSQSNLTAGLITKTLPGNYARLIGGYRFKQNNLVGFYQGIRFLEGANYQARIVIDASGRVALYGQSAAPALVATSTANIAAGTTHYLEWDITFGAAGAYNIYLDGVLVLTGTGNFKAGTNAYANGIQIGAINGNANGAATLYVDDLYLDDGSGAALLTSPYVVTEGLSSDSSVLFSPGAAIFGDWELLINATNAPGANFLFLRKFTPSQSGNLANVSCQPQATSTTANFKAVVYSDNAGTPNALLATGNQVTGTGTAAYNNVVTSAFGAPPALVAGTAYWIGFITDTSVTLSVTGSLTSVGVKAANTYASGAPGTAPAMTTAQPNWALWGTLTGVASHTYALAQAPNSVGFGGDFSYVTDANVGDEDLFNVTAFTAAPAAIYAVAVKGVFRDAAAGARTVTLQQKSGSTDSASTAFSPGLTYQWFNGYWSTDPNGNIPWTKTGLNAASVGYKIAS